MQCSVLMQFITILASLSRKKTLHEVLSLFLIILYPFPYPQTDVPPPEFVPVHESTRTSEMATSPDGFHPPRLTPYSSTRAPHGSPAPRPPILSPHPPGYQSPNQPPNLEDPPSPIGLQQPDFDDDEERAFVAADISYQAVEPVEEASIDDVTVGEINVGGGEEAVVFKLAGRTERGMPQLVDSVGYSYVVKVKRPNVTYWR